jgi:uncharacterized cupredoxin-like copper-binding protein
MWPLGLIAVLALFAGLLMACNEDDGDDEDGDETPPAEETSEETEEPSGEAEPGTLPITTLEYSFEAPASVAAGLTTVTLDNPGGEDHQAQLARLNDGVTMTQFEEALASDPSGGAALALVTLAGGPNAVASGGENEVIQDLQPGTHAMICFVSDAEGTPHFALGMLSELEVTEAATTTETAPPPPDHTITATDYAFAPPTTAAPGETTIQFVNGGAEPHEVGVWKLDEGVTMQQVIDMMSAPPPTEDPAATADPAAQEVPFTTAGGVAAIIPNSSSLWIANLEAGTYGLVCFVPNAEGVPHVELGMVAEFTVQ